MVLPSNSEKLRAVGSRDWRPEPATPRLGTERAGESGDDRSAAKGWRVAKVVLSR